MLAKKWWEFSNICAIDIFVNNKFFGVGELTPIDKSNGVIFLIYIQQIYLLVINLLILDN